MSQPNSKKRGTEMSPPYPKKRRIEMSPDLNLSTTSSSGDSGSSTFVDSFNNNTNFGNNNANCLNNTTNNVSNYFTVSEDRSEILARLSKKGEDNKVLYMEGIGDSDSESESDNEPENVGLEGFLFEDASFTNAEGSTGDDDSTTDSETSDSDAEFSDAGGYTDSDSDDDEDEFPNGPRTNDLLGTGAIESSAHEELDEEDLTDQDSEVDDDDDDEN